MDFILHKSVKSITIDTNTINTIYSYLVRFIVFTSQRFQYQSAGARSSHVTSCIANDAADCMQIPDRNEWVKTGSMRNVCYDKEAKGRKEEIYPYYYLINYP